MSRRAIYLAVIALAASLAFSFVGAAPVTRAVGGTISGRVINDLDGDGDPNDANEPGLAGWQVRLEIGDVEPRTVLEVKTNSVGGYLFSDLPGGEYRLSLPCEGQPAWWASTDMFDHSGVLDPGSSQEDQDFLIKFASAPRFDGGLKGRVVLDQDHDALPEPSEPGMAHWTIRATVENPSVCSSETLTAVSASDGSFSLTDLLPGSYYVSPPMSPGSSGLAHWAFDAPGVPIDCGDYQCFQPSYYVDVPAGGDATLDYGVLALDGTSSVSGTVYRDQNKNGILDSDEPPLDNGCQIGLTYSTPHGYSVVSPDTFTSAPGGRYEISKLLAGNYSVGCLFGPGPPINPPAGANGFPEHLLTLRDGLTTTADFGFGPQPPEPTEPPPIQTPPGEPVSTAMPVPTATPASSGAIGSPNTGTGPSPAPSPDRPATALVLLFGTLGLGLGALAVAARCRIDSRKSP